MELEFFFNSFDLVAATRDGVVEMSPGGFPELDDAKANIVEWERKFENYIKDQEIRLKYGNFNQIFVPNFLDSSHYDTRILVRKFIRLKCQFT